MSSVLRALHADTGLEVAVKVLPRYLAKNPTLLQRFLREAKSAESLNHPNIVAIYDRGLDQGRYYLVLEYVSGGDFHDRVRRDGPLQVGEAVCAIRSAAEGLRYAASRGLIHRDIKPANLLVTQDGQIKITDLGLALQTSDDDERVTRDGTTVGTVDYMAPEQARDSRATSVRSDIYSLGCTFYYLLTGAPPFPGGDIVEKLKRHFAVPPPDVRTERPEVSEALSELIKRMMAKKPEDRFKDYDELIAALDAVEKGEPLPAPPATEPLFAVVDEEEPQNEPLVALIDEEEAPPAPVPLAALIDEDDEDDDEHDAEASLGWPGGRPLTPPAPHQSAFQLADLQGAELAPIEEEEAPIPVRAAPEPVAPARPIPRSAARRAPAPQSPEALGEFYDEESQYVAGSMRSTGLDASTRTWIMRGAFAGLGFVAIVFLISWVVSLTSSTSQENPTAEETSESETIATRAPSAPSPKPKPAPPAGAVAIAKPSTPAQPSHTAVPGGPTRTSVSETTYPPEVESRFLPQWASAPVPARVDGPFVTLRRVGDPVAREETPALWRAFQSLGGTIEVADSGPYFEDDFRIAGKRRVIRAKPGFRPAILIEPPTQDYLKEKPAVIEVQGAQLVLDGLDIVVDADELPVAQSSLFLCRGSSLLLNNCTITVLGGANRKLALVQVDDVASGAGPRASSQIRLEQTLVRANALAGFELVSGGAEVVLSRSVFLSGTGPFVSVSSSARSDPNAARRIHLVRSLVACAGPAFRLEGAAAAGSAAVPAVRALGSSFVRLKTNEAASGLIAIGEEGVSSPRDILDWQGADNIYAGWPVFATAGSARAPIVADLSAARSLWPNTDDRSRESPTAADPPAKLPWVPSVALQALALDRAATFARVAAPTAFLREKTVGQLERLAAGVPSVASPNTAPLELPFDLQAPPWQGDLGAFLRDRLPQGAKRVRLIAQGSGFYETSQVVLPDGVSLEIEASGAAGPSPVTWVARSGLTAEALIEARRGDLALTGVRLVRDKNCTLKHLVRVEQGNLMLTNCWLQGAALPESGAGALIAFSAVGGMTPSADQRPACRLQDCLLIGTGDALAATVEQGSVQLTNCAVASGADAFLLNPAGRAPAQFEADLCLDHCTIVAEHSFVRLAAVPAQASPSRPWLVSTHDCAFLAAFAKTGRDAALLRVDPDSFSRGWLFWEASNDALELTHFTAAGSAARSATVRPDVRQQWVELWGANHIRGVTGPTTTSTRSGVRLVSSALQSGKVKPADLALDAAYHPGRSSLTVGADLRRLSIGGSAQPAESGRGGFLPRPGAHSGTGTRD
jgi:serine/threonine-protein kinase